MLEAYLANELKNYYKCQKCQRLKDMMIEAYLLDKMKKAYKMPNVSKT